MTSAHRPAKLRDSIAHAAPRPVMLIAAGEAPQEIDAGHLFEAAAPASVELWVVPGSRHTKGYDTRRPSGRPASSLPRPRAGVGRGPGARTGRGPPPDDSAPALGGQRGQGRRRLVVGRQERLDRGSATVTSGAVWNVVQVLSRPARRPRCRAAGVRRTRGGARTGAPGRTSELLEELVERGSGSRSMSWRRCSRRWWAHSPKLRMRGAMPSGCSARRSELIGGSSRWRATPPVRIRDVVRRQERRRAGSRSPGTARGRRGCVGARRAPPRATGPGAASRGGRGCSPPPQQLVLRAGGQFERLGQPHDHRPAGHGPPRSMNEMWRCVVLARSACSNWLRRRRSASPRSTPAKRSDRTGTVM